jgi:hypothetical protein
MQQSKPGRLKRANLLRDREGLVSWMPPSCRRNDPIFGNRPSKPHSRMQWQIHGSQAIVIRMHCLEERQHASASERGSV